MNNNIRGMSNLNDGYIVNYNLIMGEVPPVDQTILSRSTYLTNGVINYRSGALIAVPASNPQATPFLWDNTQDKKLYPLTGTQLLIGVVFQDGVYTPIASTASISTQATVATANTGVFIGGNYVAGNIPASSSSLGVQQPQAVISNIADLTGIQLGMAIYGTGMPENSVVINYATDNLGINYLLISGNVTASGTNVNVNISNINIIMLKV